MSSPDPNGTSTLPGLIVIRLLSDATFGRGEPSAGEVDIEVEHDHLGLPFLGGKALHGLLRDSWVAMEAHFPELRQPAAQVLGTAADQDESCIVRVGNATVDTPTRQWIQQAEQRPSEERPLSPGEVLRAVTEIRYQTAEERTTGAPATTTLRSSRVVLRDLVLTAPVQWLWPPEASQVRCLALAVLGVRHAGLGRNRGRGHMQVCLHLGSQPPEAFGSDLQTTCRLARQFSTDEPGTVEHSTVESTVARNHAHVNTHYLPYTLALRSPLLVTTPGGDPNSAATLPWVPGSFLRGAVARQLSHSGRLHPDFGELVLEGSVRYLNAYPVADKVRTLPAPVPLHLAKYPPDGGDKEVIDLTMFDGQPGPDHVTERHWPANQVGPIGTGFMKLGTAQAAADVRLSGRMHQQRDRATGRAWTDSVTNEAHGTVFGYEAIDAGQDFAGVVVIDADDEGAEHVAQRLRELLAGVVLLGRSKRAGYGGDPTIDWGDWQDREVRHDQVPTRGLTAHQTVRVLLTAPYVGRDPTTGQPDSTCLVEELRSQPGLEALAAQAVLVRWAFTEVGGYNRKWQLPLPRRQALAAGSVLVLRALADIDAAAMEGAEHRGLGERRVDGFGRFVWLDALTPPGPRLQATTSKPPGRPVSAPSGLALLIQRRIADQRLERAVEVTAAQIAASSSAAPAPSLLSRLRVPMRRGPDAGLAELRVWLCDPSDTSRSEAGRLRPPARRQLDRCRLSVEGWGSTTLLAWLQDMAVADSSCDGRVAILLGVDNIASEAHVGDLPDLLDDLQSPGHLLILRAKVIDGVLAWLQRRAKADSEHSEGGNG
jgi:CRISPR-associated protein Csx10